MRPETIGKPLHWIVILQPVSSAFAYRYDPWYRADSLRPVDAITDIVNDLGVKILQQYTAHGNVAFSPTGVAFVLTALYEGSAGQANKQIAEAMGLPLNRDITRIGFRDIHRRLRSYLNADGFLGGLTLSRENAKLRPGYEDVLRFYGFDLSSIEQEANVTVSMGNSSTTEPAVSAATVDLTSPLTEVTSLEGVPSATTTSMDTITSITMFPSTEATTVPSTNAAEQIVTLSADAQMTSISVTGSPTIVQNTLTTQSADSLTVLTASDNAQPSAGAESMMGLSINPAMSTGLASTTSSMDSQASTASMIVLADGQDLQMSPNSVSNAGTTGSAVMSTDAQTISTPIASSAAIVQNTTTQSANSLTSVTSSESVQPSLSADAESTAGSSSTLLSVMSNGSASAVSDVDQTSTTVVFTGDPQTSPTIAVDINNIATIASAISSVNATETPVTNVQVAGESATMAVSTNDSGTVTSMGIDMNQVSSSLSVSTEGSMATSVSSSDSAGMTIPDASVTSLSTFFNNTITSSSIINSQSNIEISTTTETAEMTTLNDFTTMSFATNVSDGVTVASTNLTSSNLGNSDNSLIANAMISPSVLDGEMSSTLVSINETSVDQSTASLNRERRMSGIESVESKLNLNMMNDVTTNKLNNNLNRSRFYKRRTRSPRGYFSSYPDEGIWMQDLEIWKSYTRSSESSSMGDTTAEISFLVNGCDVSSVSASRYIAVLPFAYFPSLHAVALEFPLDDPRYNIILLMPTDKTDAHRLARDLNGKSLRLLRKRLQPTWVRATIPSFMLRGFVTLTSFLQRLGILNVFDPRVADLSLMTSDLGVYARDIQQSIGINIRNYMKPDRTHSRESSTIVPPRRDYYRYLSAGNGLFERAGPVPFTALHPFLYFIIDTETSVSLIAGRVDDPLNSRIL